MKTSQNIQRLNFETFFRSNQDTCLSQRPLVKQGQWIGKGQLLADCINSVSGDLALGKNVLVAYMPWEGYNFEDSIVISDRLIAEDIYTSIHILRFRTEIVDNLSTKSSNVNYKFSLGSESKTFNSALSKVHTVVTPLLFYRGPHNTFYTPLPRRGIKGYEGVRSNDRSTLQREIEESKIVPSLLRIPYVPQRGIEGVKPMEYKVKESLSSFTFGDNVSVPFRLWKATFGQLRSPVPVPPYPYTPSIPLTPVPLTPKGGIGVTGGMSTYEVLGVKKSVRSTRGDFVLGRKYGVCTGINVRILTKKLSLETLNQKCQGESLPYKKLTKNALTNVNVTVSKTALPSPSAKETDVFEVPSSLLLPISSSISKGERGTEIRYPLPYGMRSSHGKEAKVLRQGHRNILSYGKQGRTKGKAFTPYISPSRSKYLTPVTCTRTPEGGKEGGTGTYAFPTQRIRSEKSTYGHWNTYGQGGRTAKLKKSNKPLKILNMFLPSSQTEGKSSLLLSSELKSRENSPVFGDAVFTPSVTPVTPKGGTGTGTGTYGVRPNDLTKLNSTERRTPKVPFLGDHLLAHLDNNGVAKVGTWVSPGDILVGKVRPLANKLKSSRASTQLAWEIISSKKNEFMNMEDRSFRLPKGVYGRVIKSEIISHSSGEHIHVYLAIKRKIQIGDKLAGRHGNKGIVSLVLPRQDMPYLADGTPIDIILSPLGVPSRMNVGQIYECLLGLAAKSLACDFKINNSMVTSYPVLPKFSFTSSCSTPLPLLDPYTPFSSKNLYPEEVRGTGYGVRTGGNSFGMPYAIREGNSESNAKYPSRQERSPFSLPPKGYPKGDFVSVPVPGTPKGICLLSEGSSTEREKYKGVVGVTGIEGIKGRAKQLSFSPNLEARNLVFLKLYHSRIISKSKWLFSPPYPGKMRLFDGRTGQPFSSWITVGYAYMLKLIHLVDNKMHSRSTGPYSLITRQPVTGKARQGGQRIGEMEAWALEGFGAAYTLQEFFSFKGDDVSSRHQWQITTMSKMVGNTTAFKTLLSELRALCISIDFTGYGKVLTN